MRRTCESIITMAAAVALVLSIPFSEACGQEEIDQRHPLTPDGTVSVENVQGSISLIGWEREEIQITGTLGANSKRFDVDAKPDRVEIVVVLPKRARDVEDTDLEIHLPEGCEVEISTVSADISSEKMRGHLYLESVSGDISATGKMEELDCQSVSGEIELGIEADHIRVNSISGDILLKSPTGILDVETVSGDVDITGGEIERLKFESVSGDFFLGAQLDEGGSYNISSHSGDLTLALPGDVGARFEIETFSGDIDNELGPKKRSRKKFSMGKSLNFSTGSGDAHFRIATFSGDVILEKQ